LYKGNLADNSSEKVIINYTYRNIIMNPEKGEKSIRKELTQSLILLDSVFNKNRSKKENDERIQRLKEAITSFDERSKRLNKDQLLLLFYMHLLHDLENTTLKEFTASINKLAKDNELVLADNEFADRLHAAVSNTSKKLHDEVENLEVMNRH
jgi:hypothetical protein